MKHLWPLLLILVMSSCGQTPQKSIDAPPEQSIACPKITASTPWNLEAKQGVDFWTCSYTYAVTGKPLFEAMISNHVGAPPLELYAFFPGGSDYLWFREIQASPTEVRTYWTFRPTHSRSMAILAINFKAADSSEFKSKAMIVKGLEL